MEERLKEFLLDYQTIRDSFEGFSSTSNYNMQTLLEFEERFINLKEKLIPIKAYYSGQYKKRDDKACSAIRARIAIAIKDGTHPTIEQAKTISASDTKAYASKEYKEFLDQRSAYYETYVQLDDLFQVLENYRILVKDLMRLSRELD